MKTNTSKLIGAASIVAAFVLFSFFGLSFKSSDSGGQVMTLAALQSKSAMKGDQELHLIVDGTTIEKIEIPSAFSSKLEDQYTIVTTINKTLNKLAKNGWKVVATENNMRTFILMK